MKKIVFFLVFLLPFVAFAQKDTIAAGVYAWQQPDENGSIVLFEGKSSHMDWLQMSANSISKTKRITRQQVPPTEEELLIVKSGMLTISIKDSIWVLPGGSVVLLMPNEKYELQNSTDELCSFYTMKYRSKSPVITKRGDTAGGSIVRDWSKLPFITQDRGGRKNYFERATALCKRFEMHLTALKAGIASHAPHTHFPEEIILMLENKTQMLIGDKTFKGTTGAVYYMSSGILHGISNDDTVMCSYLAFQFE